VISPLYWGDPFKIVRVATSGKSSAERPVIVFKCYLDDSGSRDLPVVTLGGFISTLELWDQAEPKLNEIMSQYDVDVFHAKEFHGTKPPFFKNWTKIKKQTFTEEIFSALGPLVRSGHSWTIKRDIVRKLQRVAPRSWGRMSPLCVCFSAIVMSLVSDPYTFPLMKRHGVSFLIESGNPSNAGIEQFFDRMAKHPMFEGCLRSMTFVPKASCRAIQVADFFVFYSRREMRDTVRFDGKLTLPRSAYLQIMFNHIPKLIQRAGTGDPIRVTGNEDFRSLSELVALAQLKTS